MYFIFLFYFTAIKISILYTLCCRVKPLVSAESIEINAIQEMFSGLVSKNISGSHLIAALLPTDNDDRTLEELNQLEEFIRARKNQILQSQNHTSSKSD